MVDRAFRLQGLLNLRQLQEDQAAGRLASAHADLNHADQQLSSARARLGSMQTTGATNLAVAAAMRNAAMMQIQDRYDVCIMDTRPAMELITTSALYAADVLITPVCLDKFCRDNLLLVEDKYHHLQEQGVGVEWKIFANKVENKRAQRHTYIDMVERHCWPFMETCISKGAVVENALEYYKPVMKHRSKSQVALDFMDLAMELQEV